MKHYQVKTGKPETVNTSTSSPARKPAVPTDTEHFERLLRDQSFPVPHSTSDKTKKSAISLFGEKQDSKSAEKQVSRHPNGMGENPTQSILHPAEHALSDLSGNKPDQQTPLKEPEDTTSGPSVDTQPLRCYKIWRCQGFRRLLALQRAGNPHLILLVQHT